MPAPITEKVEFIVSDNREKSPPDLDAPTATAAVDAVKRKTESP